MRHIPPGVGAVDRRGLEAASTGVISGGLVPANSARIN